MALTPQIRAPHGVTLITYETEAFQLRASQSFSLVAYGLPAVDVKVSDAPVLFSYSMPTTIKAAQGVVLVAARGIIQNPALRAWTFDLDTHEMYVLRLGNGKTLLYDRSTEKWSWWSSADFESWRASLGTNWVQSGRIAHEHGSNVVVGDDTTNILWMLDPDKGFDDVLDGVAREDGAIMPFPRVATGMVISRARNFIPCYEVYLVTDAGVPAFTGASVTLLFSDDGGRSYVSAGAIEAQAGNYQQEFAWRSLGQISAPGRFFRIEDDGALRIIQELSIADVQ